MPNSQVSTKTGSSIMQCGENEIYNNNTIIYSYRSRTRKKKLALDIRGNKKKSRLQQTNFNRQRYSTRRRTKHTTTMQ